jgi:hypothetical protein
LNSSFFRPLFYDEPAGTFSDGRIFMRAPDLTNAQDDPAVGYWHCDIANQDELTWSDKVYELFGLSPGAPIERGWAVTRYSKRSKAALEHIRTIGLKRNFSFILDAAIRPQGERAYRWIRVLAVPILADRRIVGLHGLKRAL